MANFSSHLFCELRENELISLMAKHFPNASVSSYSLCHGGLFNTTYRVDFDLHPSVILRVGPIHRELLMGYEHDMMQTEAEVMRRMRSVGIPTSELIAVSTDHEIIDRDYMLVWCLDAVVPTSLSLSDEARYQVDFECGRMLRRMHDIPCEAFGRATDVLFGKRYSNFYESIYAEILDLLEKSSRDGFFSEAECSRVQTAIEKHRAVLSECKHPVLCHGDMWSGNLLVTPTGDSCTLTAMIDVDRAYFGDPAFDLGNPWILSDGFLAGYGVTREALEVREIKIKREVSATVYFLIEAYVWHAQYNGEENAQNGKRAAFERIRYLETA